MVTEETIDLAFTIILSCIYSIFSIVRIIPHLIIKKQDNIIAKEEKKFPRIFLQVYIILTIILIFIFIFSPEWFDWSKLPNYPRALQWVGFGLGIIANLLFVYVHIHLGKNFSATLKIYSNQKLVETGPYQFVRHPMYTAFLILHIAIFLITANWFYGIIWILGLIIVLIPRVRQEEKILEREFGEHYIEYKERTGIFLPNILKKKKK